MNYDQSLDQLVEDKREAFDNLSEDEAEKL